MMCGLAASQTVAGDSFIGTWNLNIDKSPGSHMEREVVSIVSQGNLYKLVYDWFGDNGTVLHVWLVTDMKGDCVKETQSNGQPTTGKACITRLGPRAFVDDNDILRDEYTVSRDGRTLTVVRNFKIWPAYSKATPKPVKLVFDRK
jgi:hypothetical protein